MNVTMPLFGWRGTYVAHRHIRRGDRHPAQPSDAPAPRRESIAEAEEATRVARADVGISLASADGLLVVAGFACCVAMSMPQVHIVAYCGDLGYGVARGAEMLSLMLASASSRASAPASSPTRSAARRRC